MAAYGKPLAVGNGFEYWEQGGEVYRNQVGNRGPATASGVPGNARWECSKEHFERFRNVLLGKDGGSVTKDERRARLHRALDATLDRVYRTTRIYGYHIFRD